MKPDRLRIAMLSPEPRPTGGVPGMARLVARSLAAAGAEVDCYFPVENEEPGSHLADPVDGLRWIPIDLGWRWNRWYSRGGRPLRNQASQLVNRALAGETALRRLLANHRLRPYDVVYRFSTIELFGLAHHLGELPPVVLHPEVHAAGELAALHRERALTGRCEPWHRRVAVRALQRVRTHRQHTDLHRVAAVIAPSEAFARHLSHDHGVAPHRLHVIANPIDLERFHPRPRRRAGLPPGEAAELLFVGRISVRKGIDDLVALSRLLADPTGARNGADRGIAAHLDVVGGASQWSDLRPLLADLHPVTATAVGAVGVDEIATRLARADVVVQPSSYEPFALTVAEALASGTPVVVTTEVGAGEGIDPAVCRVVAPGDPVALHREIVALLDELTDPAREAELRQRARHEAERAYAPVRIAERLLAVFAEAATVARDAGGSTGPDPAGEAAA